MTHLFIWKPKNPITIQVNEILAYNVSDSITIDIATDTVMKLKNNRKIKLANGAFIHSDQGFHYTNEMFQKLVKKYESRSIHVQKRKLLG